MQKIAKTRAVFCQFSKQAQTLQHSNLFCSNWFFDDSAIGWQNDVVILVSDGMYVYPLECKAGKTMNAKSLRVYCEKYRPRLALRTSLLPYERNEEAHIVNIPLYMLFALSAELDGE